MMAETCQLRHEHGDAWSHFCPFQVVYMGNNVPVVTLNACATERHSHIPPWLRRVNRLSDPPGWGIRRP
jgi:hypothetical protein